MLCIFKDTKTQDAVLRNLHTLAESTEKISRQLKNENINIDWKTLKAFRNVVVHDYLGIDLERIWDIVVNDLPKLKTSLSDILNK
ncbi:DUF86 domain-containing protein [Candidatus Margulisiibacteriota bacterium]